MLISIVTYDIDNFYYLITERFYNLVDSLLYNTNNGY
jgi:hypothetical protein